MAILEVHGLPDAWAVKAPMRSVLAFESKPIGFR
jgi:hypothetical protein